MRSWPQKNSSRKQKIGRPQIGSRWASAMLASRSSWPWRSAERPPIHDSDVSRGHPADVHALARRPARRPAGGAAFGGAAELQLFHEFSWPSARYGCVCITPHRHPREASRREVFGCCENRCGLDRRVAVRRRRLLLLRRRPGRGQSRRPPQPGGRGDGRHGRRRLSGLRALIVAWIVLSQARSGRSRTLRLEPRQESLSHSG